MINFPCRFRTVENPEEVLTVFPEVAWERTHESEKPSAFAYDWLTANQDKPYKGYAKTIFESRAELEYFLMEDMEDWWEHAQPNVIWEKV